MSKKLLFCLCILMLTCLTKGQEFTVLRELNNSGNFNTGFFPVQYLPYNNKLYFQASENNTGAELWVTDGTQSGTQLVKDIYEGTGSAFPEMRIVYDNKLFFIAKTYETNREIWFTDGTADGTQLLKNINLYNDNNTNDNCSYPASPGEFREYNNLLYFLASDHDHGNELWSSNGTTNGTLLITDLVTQVGANTASSSCPGNTSTTGERPFVINGQAFYMSYVLSERGYNIFTVDGVQVTHNIDADISLSNLYHDDIAFLNNIVIFANSNPLNDFRSELYSFDGTTASLIMQTSTRSYSPLLNSFYTFNDKVLFLCDDNIHGREIWITDGTANGTHIVKDLDNSAASGMGFIFRPIFINDKFYFTAYDGYLYESDGTEQGTTVLTNYSVSPGSGSYFQNIGSLLYFKKYNSATFGFELWELNTSTHEFNIIQPSGADYYNPLGSNSGVVFAYNNSLYYVARYFEDQNYHFYKYTPDSSLSLKKTPEDNVSFYPNPTENEVNFSKTIKHIELYSQLGQLLFSAENIQNISTQNLPAGLYIAKGITVDEKVFSAKIIKQYIK